MVNLISSLDSFAKMFETSFAMQGVVPNNEAIVAVAQKTFGTETAMIMLFGSIGYFTAAYLGKKSGNKSKF